MKVISENENEENKKLLANADKLRGFGFLAKSCLDTVEKKKIEQMAII
jgi:hypothetical protein